MNLKITFFVLALLTLGAHVPEEPELDIAINPAPHLTEIKVSKVLTMTIGEDHPNVSYQQVVLWFSEPIDALVVKSRAEGNKLIYTFKDLWSSFVENGIYWAPEDDSYFIQAYEVNLENDEITFFLARSVSYKDRVEGNHVIFAVIEAH